MRDRLRQITQSLHDRTEELSAPEGWFETRNRYTSFLQTMLHTHLTLGLPAAFALDDQDQVSLESDRIKALKTDLRNPDDPTAASRALTPDYAFGVSYVLNGSSLGAAILLKRS